MTEDRLELATRMYELFDTGAVDRVDELFAADLTDHDPLPGSAGGIEGMKALIGAVASGFSDARHAIEFQAPVGGDMVVTQWRMTGRHTGEFLGVPPSGNPVEFKGTDIVRVRDDRIVEIRHVEQLLQAMQQISA